MGLLSSSVPDFAARLLSLLPPSWFPGVDGGELVSSAPPAAEMDSSGNVITDSNGNPILFSPTTSIVIVDSEAITLSAVLSGYASRWSSLYAFLADVQLQSRIKTATGLDLDIKSRDYLGSSLIRRSGELDPAFASRVCREILRPRNTRQAIIKVLEDLTGNTPVVIVPSYALDTGGYDVGGAGYDVAGSYGSEDLPFQTFVTIERGSAFISSEDGVNIGAGGYDESIGGYDIGTLGYSDGSSVDAAVTDAQIYAAVASVTAAGHITWVRIVSGSLGVWNTATWDNSIWL